MQLLTTRNSDVQNPLQDLRYTYDPVGNIVEIYDASKETSYYNNNAIEPRHLYTYDALYRLLSGSGRELLGLAQATSGGYAANSIGVADTRALHTYTQHFAYDELGNIHSIQHQTPTSALNWTRNYVYDGATNRLLKHDENKTLPDYTYDEHGNMLKMPHLQSMHYDYQDQLNKVVLDTSGNTAYYIYDAGGQRVRKVVEKGYVREERIYVGGYEVFRRYENSTLDLERSTVHIMDDKNRVALIEKLKVYEGETVSGSEQIRYQYSNHLGSASLELNATGQIISYEEYHPFGTTSYRSGSNETEVSLKRYKYIGKERDEETGLYYYGARYYAAWIGRFVSVDPLHFKFPYYTPYQYAGNKPIISIDLDGLESLNIVQEEEVGQQNVSNTHFFSKTHGRYLGQIKGLEEVAPASDYINGLLLRVISDSDFDYLQSVGGVPKGESWEPSLEKDSMIIKIDEKSFKDFQEINKGGHIAGTNEKSLFMILDITGSDYAYLRTRVNENSMSTNTRVEDEIDVYNGFSTIKGQIKMIIIGQAHTHPLLTGAKNRQNISSEVVFSIRPETVNVPGVSYDGEESDRSQAIEAKYPIYAIQSYDKSGDIFKVDQYGNMPLKRPGAFNTQMPVGNIMSVGSMDGQFNILIDSFFTYSNFKRN